MDRALAHARARGSGRRGGVRRYAVDRGARAARTAGSPAGEPLGVLPARDLAPLRRHLVLTARTARGAPAFRPPYPAEESHPAGDVPRTAHRPPHHVGT